MQGPREKPRLEPEVIANGRPSRERRQRSARALASALIVSAQLALGACGDTGAVPSDMSRKDGLDITASANPNASTSGAARRLGTASAAPSIPAADGGRPPAASIPGPNAGHASSTSTSAPDAGPSPIAVAASASDAGQPPSAAASNPAPSGGPKRTKPPSGVDAKKLATRPASAVNAGVTLTLGRTAAFSTTVIAQNLDLGDPWFTWTLNLGGHDVWCSEVDDDETGYRYFVYEGYVSTWGDGTIFQGDLLVTVAPNNTYGITAYDAGCQTSYKFDWRPVAPPSINRVQLTTRPASAVSVNLSSVVDRLSIFNPATLVKDWGLDDPCYTWTIEVDGRDVWCAEIDDDETGNRYFFYDGYACELDDGNPFDADLSISLAPDNTCNVNVYDFSQNVTYDFGDDVTNDFGETES